MTENRNAQNLSLGLTVVWGRKSLKLRRHIKGCGGGTCADGKSQRAEVEFMVDLRMGKNH